MLSLFSNTGFKRYLNKAKSILDANWVGYYTKPSPSLYPHQWNWDSGFIAIGLSHYNLKRAMQEIRSLYQGQWENGMLPQIIFNPDALGHYFPEPDFWQAPGGRLTSGISMPPTQALACRQIMRKALKREQVEGFLKEMWPKLLAMHGYFYSQRDPDHEGLVYIRHPWESGLDNSPSWDGPLKSIRVDKEKLPAYERQDLKHGVPAEQRPSDDDYDRYVYLVDLFRRLDYDEYAIRQECPFQIQDPLFNAILARASRELVEIGEYIGEDVAQVREWAQMTKQGIQELMWSPERRQFDPICKRSDEFLPADTASIFMPLFASAATDEQAAYLYERLDSVGFCALQQGNCYTIPNYDMGAKDFDSKNYWRGPVWINVNWMLSKGLRAYGYKAKADAMQKDMIQLPIRFGFHEYFDSVSGQGYGSGGFSWTAALFIDLVEEYYQEDDYGSFSLPWKQAPSLGEPRQLNPCPLDAGPAPPDLAPRLMRSIGELKEAFHVAGRGRVDYQAMKSSPQYQEYNDLAALLTEYDLSRLQTREDKLAFWINLYNTIVVHGIVELGIKKSVREVRDFFKAIHYRIDGNSYSPDDIEHGILRGNARPPYRLNRVFKQDDPRLAHIIKGLVDPRIHLALVCGSRSCAPIRFYDADYIDQQLETATQNFANSSEMVILPEQNKVMLSQLFKWYSWDFGGKRGALRFLMPYIAKPDKKAFLKENLHRVKIEYLHYDWNLNH